MSRTSRKTPEPQQERPLPPYVPDPERYVPSPRVMPASEWETLIHDAARNARDAEYRASR